MFEGSADGSVGALLRARRKRMQTRWLCASFCAAAQHSVILHRKKRREKRTRARHVWGSADGSVGAPAPRTSQTHANAFGFARRFVQQHNTVSSCIQRNGVKSGRVHVMFDGVGGRVCRGPAPRTPQTHANAFGFARRFVQQHNTVSSCIERNGMKSGRVHVMFEGSAHGSVGALLRARRKRMQTRLALHVVLCSSTTQCHLASKETA